MYMFIVVLIDLYTYAYIHMAPATREFCLVTFAAICLLLACFIVVI